MAVAGFATSEPYIYKSELGEGRSYDTELQLVAAQDEIAAPSRRFEAVRLR